MAEQIYEVREKGGSKRAQALVWGTEWFCQYNRVKKGVGGAKDTGGLGTSSITRRLKPATQGSGETGTTALGAAGLGVFLGELPVRHPGWHSTNKASGVEINCRSGSTTALLATAHTEHTLARRGNGHSEVWLLQTQLQIPARPWDSSQGHS